jgi:hypothetical protein
VLDNGKDFAAFLPSSPIQPQTASIRESAMAKFATSMIGSLSKIFFSAQVSTDP